MSKLNKIVLLFLVPALICIISLAQEKTPQSKDEKELVYIKNVLWPKAYHEQDTKLLNQILHYSFQSIDAAGNRTTKQDEMEYIRKNKTSVSSSRFIIERFDIYKDKFAIIDGTGIFSSVTEETNNAVSNILGMARGLVTTQRQILDNLEELSVVIVEDHIKAQK